MSDLTTKQKDKLRTKIDDLNTKIAQKKELKRRTIETHEANLAVIEEEIDSLQLDRDGLKALK